MSETLGSCIGLISLGVAITVIVFTVRIYNDTKEAKKAFEQLKLFIDEYKLDNDMSFNEFLVKLYSI